MSLRHRRRPHRIFALASLLTMIAVYTALSNAHRLVGPGALPEPLAAVLRPDVIPPTQDIAAALVDLITAGRKPPAAGGQEHAGHHHASDHVDVLLEQGVTLQTSLAITSARVLFGLAVGAPLGILIGLFMGLSRRADDYLHPIYVLLRPIPPLALITYIMLWLGHGEAHRLIPIVYAVATTLVIPTYHGVRDVASTYVVAARALGAGGTLLAGRVLLPAASPSILAGLRYAIAIAWMTGVGSEMLMSENGMGNLIVGGGLWSSRLQMRGDPAVVIVGIIALAAAGWAMDAAARLLIARITAWQR
ncbi:MAG TPA: ABC transporter permease subunit [Myxococcaceae bacterium]|nr:ABC transporter permease subunit [Myxococcaceae bacterium]